VVCEGAEDVFKMGDFKRGEAFVGKDAGELVA
jgi:hypothetical protein